MPWKAKDISSFDEVSNGELPPNDDEFNSGTSESSRLDRGNGIVRKSFSSNRSNGRGKKVDGSRPHSVTDGADGSYYDEPSENESATGGTHSMSSENGWSPRSVRSRQSHSELRDMIQSNIKDMAVPTAPLETDSHRSNSQEEEIVDYDDEDNGSRYSEYSEYSEGFESNGEDHEEDYYHDSEDEQLDEVSLDYSGGDNSHQGSRVARTSPRKNVDPSRDNMLQGVVNTYFGARSGRDSPMFELENVDYISHFETASNDQDLSTVAFITKEVASGIFCRRLIPLEIPLLNPSQPDDVSSVSSESDSSTLAASKKTKDKVEGKGRTFSKHNSSASEAAVRILQENSPDSESSEEDPLRLKNVAYLPSVEITNDHRDISTVGVLSYTAADAAFQKLKRTDKLPLEVVPISGDQTDDVSTIQGSVTNLLLIIPSHDNSNESMSSMCSGSLESRDVRDNPTSDEKMNDTSSDIAVRIRSKVNAPTVSKEKAHQEKSFRSVEKQEGGKNRHERKQETNQDKSRARASFERRSSPKVSTRKKRSHRSLKSENESKHSKARDEIEKEVMKVLMSDKEANKTISSAKHLSEQLIERKKSVKKKPSQTENKERTQNFEKQETEKPKRKPSSGRRSSTTDPSLMIQDIEYVPKIDVASHNRDLSTAGGHKLSVKDASLAFGLPGITVPHEIPIHDMEDISTIHCEIRCQEEIGGSSGEKIKKSYLDDEDEETGFVSVRLDSAREDSERKKKLSLQQLRQDSFVVAGKVQQWTSRTAHKVKTETGPFIERMKKDIILLWRKYMGGRSNSEIAVIIVIAISLFVLFVLLMVVLAKG